MPTKETQHISTLLTRVVNGYHELRIFRFANFQWFVSSHITLFATLTQILTHIHTHTHRKHWSNGLTNTPRRTIVWTLLITHTGESLIKNSSVDDSLREGRRKGQFKRRKCNGKTMKKEKCSGNCTHSTRIAWQSRRLSARDSRKENPNYGRRKAISRKRNKEREDGLRHPSVRHNCSAKEKNEKKARTQTSRKPDLLSHPSRFSVRLFSNFQSRSIFLRLCCFSLSFPLGRQLPTQTDTDTHRMADRDGEESQICTIPIRSEASKENSKGNTCFSLSLSFLSIQSSHIPFSLLSKVLARYSWIYSFRPFLFNPFPFSAQEVHDNLYHSRHIHLHASHITIHRLKNCSRIRSFFING